MEEEFGFKFNLKSNALIPTVELAFFVHRNLLALMAEDGHVKGSKVVAVYHVNT